MGEPLRADRVTYVLTYLLTYLLTHVLTHVLTYVPTCLLTYVLAYLRRESSCEPTEHPPVPRDYAPDADHRRGTEARAP